MASRARAWPREPEDVDPAIVAAVVQVLADALLLSPEVAGGLSADTPLFGQLPELDSMAVATVLTALEDRFGILIDDEDVTAGLFATVGTLAAFVASRRP
ncbi:MAG: acyl carrier protein [Sphingomonadaceae bacterium]|uniref:acyl carrier protein n=1 Tax=Thermaurantiacus sp. TaxID=2820283 RepID=UPI00298F1FF9|nr:acyl carrier protein [Thermaurantiacus sp.]MCS6986756.1 acyl carrier protein [Sphingomonadaceae bacterium]MDW8413981.1 acyl carrier protein [Thermaurantiacus sp.]